MTIATKVPEPTHAAPPKMLRLWEVLAVIPVSKSTFYAGITSGRFPAPVKTGRISLWRSQDIAKWLSNPTITNVNIPKDVSRLAASSAVFSDDIALLADLSRKIESVALGVLMQAYVSRASQMAPNDYDRSCLERVRTRFNALKNSAKPSLDLMGYWRPQ